MEWKNKPMEWKNEGTPPSLDLVDMGFVGGYKPPASVFNHFFSTHQKLLDEVQENVDLLQRETQTETADIRNTIQANVDELKATIGSNTEAFEAALEEQLTSVTADIESRYNELNTGKADKTQTEASINAINGNINTINTNMGTKVDKVEGKGLSSNDFTNEHKVKTDIIKTDLTSGVFLAGDGTYQNVSVSDAIISNKLDKTDGGTVTGAVNFTGGLTKNGKNVATYETGSCDIRFNNAAIGYKLKKSNYMIIGSMCIVSFYILCNGTVPSAVSNLVLTGFPVPINTTNESIQPCYMSYLKEPAVSAQTGGVRFTEGAARIVLSLTTSRWSYNATSAHIQGDTVFSGTVIYQV